MKYQHIVNKIVLFETNDAASFTYYILNDPTAIQAKDSVLYNLLVKSNGYICDMYSKDFDIEPTEADFWDGDESDNFLQ